MIETEQVQKAIDYLRETSRKEAESVAHRMYMEEYRKVVKAQIMGLHKSLPVSAQEREAYEDDRYDQHLKALQLAIEKEREFAFRRKAAEAVIEAWRTECANDRGQAKIG